MNCLYNWGRYCIFSALVYWEITKRYISSVRYYGNRFLQFLFCDESDIDIRRRSTWGRSAPSLDVPPIPLTRPISQRVLGAWLFFRPLRNDNVDGRNWPAVEADNANSDYYPEENKNDVTLDDDDDMHVCTGEFRAFLDEQNLLSRDDIFHNFLRNFHVSHGENDRLVVFYKNGMRTFAVVYKTDIVFPPSVPQQQPTNNEMPLSNEMDTSDPEIIKLLQGPGQDFYIGSTYQAITNDVLLVDRIRKKPNK
jgi:hypothetical protein